MTEDYNNYGFPKLPKKSKKKKGETRLRSKDEDKEKPVNSKMQALAGKGMGQEEDNS